MRLAVTTGARRNAGDHLIHERGRQVLARLLPDAELVSVPRWEALPDPAGLDGLCICGGPGLSERFFPDLYPVLDGWDGSLPVMPLALGWSGTPRSPDDFVFSEASKTMLHRLDAAGTVFSTRDDISARLVSGLGVASVRTGCVAWYDRDTAQLAAVRPTTIRSVAVSAPAQASNYAQLRTILPAIARRFPRAAKTLTFHAGFKRARSMHRSGSRAELAARVMGARHGYSVRDLSSSGDGVSLYDDVDLHVGYRVHAHLACLSWGRPSILISEDGRGLGQAETLGDPYQLTAWGSSMPDAVAAAVDTEVASGFEATQRAVEEIRSSWPVMRSFVTGFAERLAARPAR